LTDAEARFDTRTARSQSKAKMSKFFSIYEAACRGEFGLMGSPVRHGEGLDGCCFLFRSRDW
jgi:hypothetical protein